MQNIDLIEHGSPGLTVRHQGELLDLPDPRELNYQAVLAILQSGHVPVAAGDLPLWKDTLIFERWSAAYDLPDFTSAQRLAYLVDHYRSAIVYDLRVFASVDLGELWRARRWRTLLDLIDHLPGHGWYAASVSMDPEHARMMAESMAARRDAGEADAAEDSGPPLVHWTPEYAKLTDILDAIRHLDHTTAAVQVGKAAGPPPEPSPRPITPIQRELKAAEYRRRKQNHETLVARLLPHKRASQTPD